MGRRGAEDQEGDQKAISASTCLEMAKEGPGTDQSEGSKVAQRAHGRESAQVEAGFVAVKGLGNAGSG